LNPCAVCKYQFFSNHSGPGFSFFDQPGSFQGCSDALNAFNPVIPINPFNPFNVVEDKYTYLFVHE
jgi:hypothetical protein